MDFYFVFVLFDEHPDVFFTTKKECFSDIPFCFYTFLILLYKLYTIYVLITEINAPPITSVG